jgi:uncharacterized membrane protein
MLKKFSTWGLWVSTIIIVLLAALQALSGHWVIYFFLWPGGPSYGSAFVQAMVSLASYHRMAGFTVGALSIVVLFFAFASKPSIYVRIFAVVGFIMVALAASGGILYVTSGLQDRMGLGRMADAFVGVLGAYLIQLFFMNRTPAFPWTRLKEQNMIRCKACGYIMKEGKLGDRCPACGAPRTAFEPYTDPMSRPRRLVLSLQLHPIATHFPITFVVAALVFSIVIPFLPGEARSLLVGTVKILSLLIPLVVVIAFLVGLWDGRVRFRKIGNSRILKTKILYAVFLFVVSVALAFVVWAGEYGASGAILGAILLSAAALVLVFLLGTLGTSILGAAFPGK